MGKKETYKLLSDEELAWSSKQGDSLAFTELYDRYAGKIQHFFIKMLWQDQELALDYTQELFTKIIQDKSRYQKGRKFSTWLYSIAHNMCKNAYRAHEVRTRHQENLKEHLGRPDNKSMDEVDKKAFKSALAEELNKLGTEKRSAFIMRYKQGMSLKEIAEVCDCSVGTIKSRLFYTLKDLSKELHVFKNTIK